MGSATVMSEGARDDKFAVAAEIYNRAAEIGRAAGVTVAVHPSSHHNTLLFTRADYDRIFALLEPQRRLGAGHRPHPARRTGDRRHAGGASRPHPLRPSQGRGRRREPGRCWAKGACDIPAVIEAVAQAPRFNGWIVVEEESETAAADPAAAVRTNRATLRSQGYA